MQKHTRPISSMTLAAIILLIAPFSITSAQRDQTRRVRFPRGRTSVVLRGAVVRGTRNNYILGARKGQALRVSITSREKNAVFDVCSPDMLNAGCGQNEYGDYDSTLTESGDVVISVAPTRGNATYTLEISIRDF